MPPHSHEFHAASIGPAAEACILDSAKAMAMTAIDLAADPVLLQTVKEEFAAASGPQRPPLLDWVTAFEGGCHACHRIVRSFASSFLGSAAAVCVAAGAGVARAAGTIKPDAKSALIVVDVQNCFIAAARCRSRAATRSCR